MELEFRFEEGDVLAFLEYHRSTPRRRGNPPASDLRLRVSVRHIWSGVLVFREAALAIAFLVLGPLWIAWWPARSRRNYRKQAAACYRGGPNPMFEGPHLLRLEDAGLVVITPSAESRMRSRPSSESSDTPDYFFVYVGAVQAIVVPRRRVSRGDADIFVQELRRRIGAPA